MDDSLLESPQSCWSYVASFQLTHCQDSVLLQPAAGRCSKQHERCVNVYSSRPASISHTLPSLTSSFSFCYVICRRRSVDAQRSPCDDADGDGLAAEAIVTIMVVTAVICAEIWNAIGVQPNSREKMCYFTEGFWKYAQLHEKFTVRDQNSRKFHRFHGPCGHACRHCQLPAWHVTACVNAVKQADRRAKLRNCRSGQWRSGFHRVELSSCFTVL